MKQNIINQHKTMDSPVIMSQQRDISLIEPITKMTIYTKNIVSFLKSYDTKITQERSD